MARYRIVQRPSCIDPSRMVYDVQKRQLPFYWGTTSGPWLSIESAEEYVMQLKTEEEIDKTPKVVKEYD